MKFSFSIHPIFVLFLFVIVMQGLFDVLLVYLITILLHEFAHFLVARKLGYNLNRFTLMPHGISLSGENELFSKRDEVLIAIAGPICNLCLAILSIAFWWIFPSTYSVTNLFVVSNLCTFFVNLFPIFPLDGGRVALAILSKKTQRKHALKILKSIGLVVSILILLAFVLTTFFSANFSLLVLGLFCFMTVLWEDKTSVYQKTTFFLSKKHALKRGIVVREVAVDEDMTLYKLLNQIRPDSLTNFKVLKKDLSVLGTIKENQIEKLIQIYPASTTLKIILS